MTPDSDATTLPAAMTTVRDERVAILVGAEGPGLSYAAMKASDLRVRIPMSRGTDSLNVATAAALAFYERARLALMADGSMPTNTPWATGLTVAGFVAAATAVAVVVLSLGLIRVHPMLAVGLNVVAAGGLAPTLWGWRHTPVLRWLVLGAGVGVTGAWLALVAMAL